MLFRPSLPKLIDKASLAIGGIGYAAKLQNNQTEVSLRGTSWCIKEGYFLTCKHVYDQMPDYGKKNIKIWLFDRKADNRKNYPAFDAELVLDNDVYDYAIFKIKNCNLIYKPLQLEDSDTVEAGQDVFFAGFPGITQTLNQQILSFTFAVRRCIISNTKKAEDGSNFYLLFDAECNEGFSGSPFISIKSGKVLGYVARRFRQLSQKTDDIDRPAIFGWAYPINRVKKDLEKLIN